MKKWVRRIIVTAVLLVASVSIILFGYNKLYNDKQPEGDIIVKENVKVITSETDNIPIDVREDYLVFGEKPEYKKGDVIVSGITENSLEGYIRRVLKVDKKNNLYIVKTEPAVLTDVFEKVHIYKKIELTEDGSQSVSYKTESMKGEKKREAFNIEVCKDEKEKKEEKEDKDIDENDNGTDYVIGKKFEEKDEPVTVSGEAGISIWVEIDIDINHEIEEAKEQVKTSYSNEYFEVEVPESWEGDWSVIEEDNTNNGIKSTVYHFTYNPEGPDNGGASDVYVIDMSDTSRPMGHYNRMLPDYCEEVGVTSFGSNDVFKMEVAAGFFHDGGATITLK